VGEPRERLNFVRAVPRGELELRGSRSYVTAFLVPQTSAGEIKTIDTVPAVS
jgi:hypothetical protein